MGKPGVKSINTSSTSLPKVPQFCCGFEGCRKYFDKLSQLKYHQNTHLKDKPYKCLYEGCSSAYFRPNHLKRHIQSAHESGLFLARDHRCPEEGCGAAFDSETSLYYHSKRKHSTQPYQCSFCDKKFSKKWMFKEHEASHTGGCPFKCEEEGCSQEFKEYKLFKSHKRDHAKKNNVKSKVLVCGIGGCQQSFTKWSELVNHKKAYHPKATECHICHKTFTKGNMKVHLQVHQDESDRKALMCPIEGCPRFYFHQKNLNHHMRVKHHDQGFQCALCERKLSSKQKLDKHIKVIHEEERKTGKSKKKAKKSTSILKKLSTMTDADWNLPLPGPPRYVRQKYDCIKFPDAVSKAEDSKDSNSMPLEIA